MSFEKGLCGLTNIGNTCYGNATLQALRHQVDLTIYILQDQHTELLNKKTKSEKTEFVEAYGQLVKAMWTGDGSIARTNYLWSKMLPSAVKEGYGQFRQAIAHDSHEFLVFMLDQIHEALAEEVTMTIKPLVRKPDVINALEYWKKSFEKKYSPMVELLFFMRRKSVVCQGCKNENVSWEHRMTNELCVKKGHAEDLIDLIIEDCKGGEVDDYECDKCPTRQKVTVSYTYWRLGNWVVITLKRNEKLGNRINTHINVPKRLSFAKVFHEGSEESSAKCEYELFSTIEHHGSHNGGHYTAHAKHPVTGKWIFYDDENAIPVDDVRISPSTYTVMYRKVVA